MAAVGNTVLVSNGVYDTGGAVTPGTTFTNRVCITNSITVRSTNGPAATIIKGAFANGGSGNCGPDAVRCVYMTNGATLIGFTLTNGAAGTSGGGGGVYLDHGGVVSNCVITCNKGDSFYLGGGVGMSYGGTMNNCMLAGNTNGKASGRGGGAGISFGGTMNYCILSNNTVGGGNGGGVSIYKYGTLNNCTVVGNNAQASGGVHTEESWTETLNCTLNNCTIAGNTADRSGGGVSLGVNARMNNCLVVGNTAKASGITAAGGGVNCGNSAMSNCTVAGNTATNYGGGVCFAASTTGTMNNCIIWGNNHVTSSNIYFCSGASAVVNYTCSGPVQTDLGSGNIGSNPQFVDTNSGNYQIAANSPCINRGTNANWMANSVDLDGRQRIRYGTVDMGCYERIYNGTFFTIP